MQLAEAALKAGLQIADAGGHKVDRPKEDRFELLGQTIEQIANLQRHEIVGEVVVDEDDGSVCLRTYGVEHFKSMSRLARMLSKVVGRKVRASINDCNVRKEVFEFEDEEQIFEEFGARP
jgi:hypothetical protein